jgi:hypothetical protein
LQRQQEQQILLLLGIIALVWMEPAMGFFASLSSSSSSFSSQTSNSLYNTNNNKMSAVVRQSRMNATAIITAARRRSSDDNNNHRCMSIHCGEQQQRLLYKLEIRASQSTPELNRRRSIIQSLAGVVTLSLHGWPVESSMAGATVVPVDVSSTITEEVSSSAPATANAILSRLGSIPTFVLVQGDTGIPFMIFNGERSATGYFFLSYNIAEQALRDAREKDKATGGGSSTAVNIWDTAQVRVVPLSIAMQLALSSQQRVAANNDKAVEGTYIFSI